MSYLFCRIFLVARHLSYVSRRITLGDGFGISAGAPRRARLGFGGRRESIFRQINESICRQIYESKKRDFVCECEDPECRAVVRLTTKEFESVALLPDHFVVGPAHKVVSPDRLVFSNERFAVVSEAPAAA